MSDIQDTDLFVIQRPSGSTAGTYKITALEFNEYATENAPPPIEYQGARDFTDSDDDPLSGTDIFTPKPGDLLINDATSVGNWAWTQLDPELGAPIEVKPGERCIWNGAGYWELITSGGSGTLVAIDGTYPITVLDDDPTIPVVEIEPAKQTDGSTPVRKIDLDGQGGAVVGLAIDTDVVSSDVPSPNPYSVVTADLLKATNDEVESIPRIWEYADNPDADVDQSTGCLIQPIKPECGISGGIYA